MGLKFIMVLVGLSLSKKINIIATDIFVIFYKPTNLLNRDWMQTVNSGL